MYNFSRSLSVNINKKILFLFVFGILLFPAGVVFAAPIISSVSPASYNIGPIDDPGVPATINGSGFSTTSSQLYIKTYFADDSLYKTFGHSGTFVNSTTLTTTIGFGPFDVPSGGYATVQIIDLALGNSNEFKLSVSGARGDGGTNPVLTFLSPTSYTIGNPSFTLRVGGFQFTSNSIVYLNMYQVNTLTASTPLSTTFLNASQLTAIVPAIPSGTALPSGARFEVIVKDSVNGNSTAIAVTVTEPSSGSGGSGGGRTSTAPSAGGSGTFNPGNVPNQVANLGLNDLIDILFRILWIVFVAFAIVMFLLAGIQFFTAQGDASKVADARNFVLWGVVGMVVALLAFSLPFIIRNTLGNGI